MEDLTLEKRQILTKLKNDVGLFIAFLEKLDRLQLTHAQREFLYLLLAESGRLKITVKEDEKLLDTLLNDFKNLEMDEKEDAALKGVLESK